MKKEGLKKKKKKAGEEAWPGDDDDDGGDEDDDDDTMVFDVGRRSLFFSAFLGSRHFYLLLFFSFIFFSLK